MDHDPRNFIKTSDGSIINLDCVTHVNHKRLSDTVPRRRLPDRLTIDMVLTWTPPLGASKGHASNEDQLEMCIQSRVSVTIGGRQVGELWRLESLTTDVDNSENGVVRVTLGLRQVSEGARHAAISDDPPPPPPPRDQLGG